MGDKLEFLDEVNLSKQTVASDFFANGFKSLTPIKTGILLVAIYLSSFSLYTGFFGLLESWKHRMIHLSMILLLVFLTELNKKVDSKKKLIKKGFAFIFLLATIAVSLYAYIDYENIIMRMGRPNQLDMIFGFMLVLIVLSASLYKLGISITFLGSAFVFYALFGYLFPDAFYHRGMSLSRFIDFAFIQTNGILGVPIKVAAEYVIMFIIFGAFLTKSGAGEFFIRIAFALTGKMWGGPAKSAVVASALMATINGSGVGNAVATGSITIPLMKRVGYKPHFAAAIEAAASNGGMITPPVMASVAFLIAEFTGTPYATVMLHGAIPAFLYFSAIMIMVHLEAKKMDLKPMSDDEIPDFIDTIKKGWFYLVPIFSVIWMLISGYSPMRAASYGILLFIIVSFLSNNSKMTPVRIIAALEEGARNTIMVSVACAVAGIVVGVITGTGLGIRVSSVVIAFAGESLFMVLFLTMISSIILGMGMTAAAVYVIVTALTVPALIEVGVLQMPAHFFVYYYGIASAITPPVALAAYGAAGIAGSDNNKTALTAMKLAIVTFVVPFAFVYNPALLAIGGSIEIIRSIFFALVGVVAMSAGLSNWFFCRCKIVEQALLVLAGIGLLTNLVLLNILSLFLLLVVLGYHYSRHKEIIVTA